MCDDFDDNSPNIDISTFDEANQFSFEAFATTGFDEQFSQLTANQQALVTQVTDAQQTGFTCAVQSIRSVLADAGLIDEEIFNETTMAVILAQNDLLTTDGMSSTEIENALNFFGVEAEAKSGATLFEIDKLIEEGHAVIAGVDGFKLFTAPPAEHQVATFTDSTGNHAIRVLDVDVEKGRVQIYDSGDEHHVDGTVRWVTAKDWYDASDASDRLVIVSKTPIIPIGELA